jgi:hypothetical protein
VRHACHAASLKFCAGSADEERVRTLAAILLVWCLPFSPLAAETRQASSAPLQTDTAIDRSHLVVPHVVDGAGWKTTIVLVNLGSAPAYYTLTFVSESGGFLNLPLAGEGVRGNTGGSLEANGTALIETAGLSGRLQQGWAFLMTYDRPPDQAGAAYAPAALGGMAVLRQHVAGRPDFEAAVPFSSMFDTQFVAPFDNRDGFSTRLTLVNPSASAASPVTLTIRDTGGGTTARHTLTLPPRNHTAFDLAARYPEMSGQAGSILVSTTAGSLSGMGLRFSPDGAFTTVRTLSLPFAPTAVLTPAITFSGTANTTCDGLAEARIFAADGQFLGRITTDLSAVDSIANGEGAYGSRYSGTSIFDAYGRYGSQASALSAFNAQASAPPLVYAGESPAAYLTVNPALAPAVSPNDVSLCILKALLAGHVAQQPAR